MKLRLSQANTWQQYTRPIASCVPRRWQTWLFDQGSLTERIVKRANGCFHVRVDASYHGIPNASERMALGMPPRTYAIIREVTLCGNNEPWVMARSIIPLTSLIGRQRQLLNIGSRPLGALLFAHPNMQRGAIEIATLKTPAQHEAVWARRSIFTLDNQPILVMETFLPKLLSNT